MVSQCTLGQPVAFHWHSSVHWTNQCTLAQGKGCVHHLERRSPTLGGTCINREWTHIAFCDKIAKWAIPDWSIRIYEHWWIHSSMWCCGSLKKKLFLVIKYQYYTGLMRQSTSFHILKVMEMCVEKCPSIVICMQDIWKWNLNYINNLENQNGNAKILLSLKLRSWHF